MFVCGEKVMVFDFFDDIDCVEAVIVGIGTLTIQTRKPINYIVKPLSKIGDWECYNVSIVCLKKIEADYIGEK